MAQERRKTVHTTFPFPSPSTLCSLVRNNRDCGAGGRGGMPPPTFRRRWNCLFPNMALFGCNVTKSHRLTMTTARYRCLNRTKSHFRASSFQNFPGDPLDISCLWPWSHGPILCGQQISVWHLCKLVSEIGIWQDLNYELGLNIDELYFMT